jgi:hypothetical protein
VPALSGHVQGRDAIIRRNVGADYGLVCICAELVDHDSQNVEIVPLGRSAQRHGRNHPDAEPRPASQLGDISIDAALGDGVV